MSISKKIEVLFEDSKTETNNRDNEIKRSFFSTDRLWIDCDVTFTSEGWLQFDTDQDASYFGFWVNPKTLQTLCYAEGDWTLCTCRDVDHYNAEITSSINFYDESYEFKTIDAHGQVTVYQQNREKFLIK